MPTRREFLAVTGAGLAAAAATAAFPVGSLRAAAPSTRPTIKAVAFDAFPIFDPRPVFALAEDLFPGRGPDLAAEWRTRQFDYAWLRALSHRYADFGQVTRDALAVSAARLKLDLTPDKADRLMNAYLRLKAWPEVPAALAALRKSGLRLAFLSNFSPAMLDANVKSAGLTGVFDLALSTDLARTYKPAPAAYQLGVDRLGLAREQILFVAFAGWDAAGAKSFGYPTFWLNRQHAPPDRLDAAPDATGDSLADVVKFLA